ncbi:DNA-binding protein (plasmid) [Antarctobacter heliothermus]|uniref:DNA-binding protein n=1 Tax=Antarctobacter heliothermus TaxID=74033 RepID=A0A222EBJ1_9RHOB|nr:Zn-ribbon domain-containing OB-fold protein [Antarctobacter heliothermus]ASP23480.1 DNA-binding protein [Antarctobacter heliothermus]
MTDYTKPLPKSDPVTAPFWDSLRRKAVEVQCCEDCNQFLFYPRAHCPACGSRALTWKPVSGRGTIYTMTIVEKTGNRNFKQDCPYVVALVELEEGCRMMSNIIDVTPAPQDVRIGMPVEIVYDAVTDDVTLPKFRPVAG